MSMKKFTYRSVVDRSEYEDFYSNQESMTHQSFVELSDVNNLIRKFQSTGELPGKAKEPFYADFSDAMDYKETLGAIQDAHHSFNSLPSIIRDRFANSPAELLRFLEDSNNYDEAIALGLLEKRPQVASPSAEGVRAEKPNVEPSKVQ